VKVVGPPLYCQHISERGNQTRLLESRSFGPTKEQNADNESEMWNASRSIIITIMTNFRNETELKCLESETWAINAALPRPHFFFNFFPELSFSVPRSFGYYTMQAWLGICIPWFGDFWPTNIYMFGCCRRERKSQVDAEKPNGKPQLKLIMKWKLSLLRLFFLWLSVVMIFIIFLRIVCSIVIVSAVFCPIMIRLSARKAGIKVNFMPTFWSWLANPDRAATLCVSLWFGATLNISIRSYCRVGNHLM